VVSVCECQILTYSLILGNVASSARRIYKAAPRHACRAGTEDGHRQYIIQGHA
jgi:hypothetical protein